MTVGKALYSVTENFRDIKRNLLTVLSIEYFINAIIGLVPLMHPVIKGMVFTSTGP